MRILLSTFAFLPESVGGTEVYVAALSRELKACGHEVVVVIPASEETRSGGRYVLEGIDVRRCRANGFLELLEEFRPDIVHFHPLTGGDLLSWVEASHDKKIPNVCTYHTPTLTCGRGDMLQYGEHECDGRLDARVCASCVLHSRGLPRLASIAVASWLPRRTSEWRFVPRKVRSALSIASQRHVHRQAWDRLVACVDHWVSVAAWVKDLLVRNGVDPSRVTTSRQGVCAASDAGCKLSDRPMDRAVIGFLGRIHPHKGLHVLIESLGHVEGDGLELRIAGAPSTFGRDYANGLVKQTRDDPRIRWLGGVSPDCTLPFLSELDVLVVPYLGFETGPMTVLEAWAAGTPVIGSNRGGIAEWIEQFGGGQLFPPGDSAALTRILAQGFPTRFSALRAQVPREVRRMSDVADEMVHLYSRVQKSRKDRHASID